MLHKDHTVKDKLVHKTTNMRQKHIRKFCEECGHKLKNGKCNYCKSQLNYTEYYKNKYNV